MASKPVGQVLYFRSKIDGQLQPCAVCATDDGTEPKALILEVSPGASAGNLPKMIEMTEQVARMAAAAGHSAVVLRPTGRGPGSLYMNYGEVDLFEAVACVCEHFPIDRDRITVTGGSMGGAATWYLVSHYPDVFAAAAPFCGYCDWRLWEKPGGLTFHTHEWEVPSWQARSAAMLAENLIHTPVWMTHGAWDRSVGGGVPVEHSLQMARQMEELGYAHKLTIVPETGHGCRTDETWPPVIDWLPRQRKTRDPRRVWLATYSLRHNRSYWVAVEQLVRYGERGSVNAELTGDGLLTVTTENVAALTLGPAPAEASTVVIDGDDVGTLGSREQVTFVRSGDAWQRGDAPAGKRHGQSGPIGDMFHGATILVPGTTGSAEATFMNEWVANHARGYFSSRNGGVHRGGIMGQNSAQLPLVADAELSDQQRTANNLLLYGTPESNSVLARYADALPVAFEGETIRLAGKTYTHPRAAVLAVFPHPDNDRAYLAVHGGPAPDAVTWGSHLDMMLLPDYIVYAGGEVLDWGFWNSDWTT